MCQKDFRKRVHLPPLFQDVEANEAVTSDRIFQRFALEIMPLGQDTAQDDSAADTQMAALFDTTTKIPRLPANWRCHQMFGIGNQIQTAVEENMLNHMRFQLQTEACMHPQFRNLSVYQFWISQDALERRDWAAIDVTFECD